MDEVSLLIVGLAIFTLIFWGWFRGAVPLAAGFMASALVFRWVRLRRVGAANVVLGQGDGAVRERS